MCRIARAGEGEDHGNRGDEKLVLSMRRAINEADVVSIVGYSMPATDNMARQEILGSLKHGQRVNLVVGSDSFTSGRMQSLIQPIVGTNGLGVSRVVVFEDVRTGLPPEYSALPAV